MTRISKIRVHPPDPRSNKSKSIYIMLTSGDIRFMASNGEGYNAEFKVRVPQKVRDLAELSQPDFGLKGTFDISLERVHEFVPEPVKIAGLSEIQNRALALIGENNIITADELSEKLAIVSRQTRRIIKHLKDCGYIEREGSRKAGVWIVKVKMS